MFLSAVYNNVIQTWHVSKKLPKKGKDHLLNLNHIFIVSSISACLKLYKYLKTGREWNIQMEKDNSFEEGNRRGNMFRRSIRTPQWTKKYVNPSFLWFPCLDFMACGAGESSPLLAGTTSCCFDIHISLWYKLEKLFSEACRGGRPESSYARSALTRQRRTQKLPLIFRPVGAKMRLRETIKCRNTPWRP